jgi:parallel beta-helix repeat protein
MKNRILATCSVSLLILLIPACSGGSSSATEPTSLSTDPARAGDLADVQRAINDAAAGDTVAIGAGTFSGRLVVRKPLILVGQGSATVLTGVAGLDDAAIEVRDTTGVEVRNVTLSAPDGGIRVRGCVDVLVEGVVARDNGDTGIEVRSSSDVVVRNCDAVDNVGHGVRVREASQNVLVEDCLVASNLDHGVEVRDALDVTLRTSVVRDNAQSGVRLRDSAMVLVFDNDVVDNVEYGVRIRDTAVDVAVLNQDNRIDNNGQGNVRVE